MIFAVAFFIVLLGTNTDAQHYYGSSQQQFFPQRLPQTAIEAAAEMARRRYAQPPAVVRERRPQLQPSEQFSREEDCMAEVTRADEDWWAMVADGKDPSQLSPAGGRCYRRFWEDKKNRTAYDMAPVEPATPPSSGEESKKPDVDSSPKKGKEEDVGKNSSIY